MKRGHLLKLTLALAIACVGLTCSDNATDSYGTIDFYGRIIYRPPFVGSNAEFYFFHNGEAYSDAIIAVENDTIPLVNSGSGYYSMEIAAQIGDTLVYSVDSPIWTSQGTVIIPDTSEIIQPIEGDTLRTGVNCSVVCRFNTGADGYFFYLDGQDGFAAEIGQTAFDTSAVLNGFDIVNGGSTYLWIESLRGVFNKRVAPNGMILPLGVVGAAGNYREVYVSLSR